MNTHYVDYKRTLDLVRRINRLVEKNPVFEQVFNYKNYNVWQSFQGSLFADVKVWTIHEEDFEINRSFGGDLLVKNITIILWMWCVSFLSALFLLVSRRKIIIFTIDKISGKFKNDLRLEQLYAAADLEKSKFFEIVHCIPGREMLHNFFNRRRPVIYLEAIDAFSYPFLRSHKKIWNQKVKDLALEDFAPRERRLVRLLLVKYATSVGIFSWRIRFLGHSFF